MNIGNMLKIAKSDNRNHHCHRLQMACIGLELLLFMKPHPAVMVKTMVKRWDTYIPASTSLPGSTSIHLQWMAVIRIIHSNIYFQVYILFSGGSDKNPIRWRWKEALESGKSWTWKLYRMWFWVLKWWEAILDIWDPHVFEVFGSSKFVHDHWRPRALDCSMCYFKEKHMLMPDQMHLFGCAQTSWSFWNSLCDYKANIYTWYVSGNMLYMYLLQSITRYIYICYQN